MTPAQDVDTLRERTSPLDMSAAAFRTAGHDLVNRIADWLEQRPEGPVSHDDAPSVVRRAI